jgi:hypothetical protein
MSIGWREALAGVAVLFVAFLLVKMRPSSRRRAAVSDELKAARARVHEAKTPEDRARALTEAGRLAGVQARWTAAAGLFLRAMKAAPTDETVVAQTVETLRSKRPKLLEKILWRRLAHTDWDAAHGGVTRAAAEGLLSLYQGKLRDSSRAAFFRRLLAKL